RANPLHARPLIGKALRDIQPVDVAAEPGLLLRVGDRRAHELFDVARDDLAREAQRRERVTDVAAADLIQHQAGFLRRGADVLGGGLGVAHDAPPLPPPAPPPAPAGADDAAAATCAAFSALVVWPLNCRVGANSPSLCPTMFSVMYTGMNFLPLWTAIVWPTISGITVERRDQVLMTFLSVAWFMASTFSRRWTSMNGPFFSDLPIATSSFSRR